MYTDPEMKPYRGGCTDSNWSNATCSDWCNDGKQDASAVYHAALHRKNIDADNFSNSVHPNGAANIFRCPDSPWVYCDQSLPSPCQSGPAGLETYTYTRARFLGTPPIPSSEGVTTLNPSILTSSTSVMELSTSVTESTASSTLAHSPTCTNILHQSSESATAIGVGLGLPFGIAAVGFLVFLFWRDTRKKGLRRPKQYISRDERTRGRNTPIEGRLGRNDNTLLAGGMEGNDNALTDGEMDGNGLQLELQGSMITAELNGNETVQEPNSTAPRALG